MAQEKKKTAGKKNSAAKKTEVVAESPLVLEEKIGIQTISNLVERLESLLSSDSKILIDASAVQYADIAALQVLTAFSNSARAQSRPIEWQCENSVLPRLCALADLDRHINFDAPAEVVEEDDGLCPVF